MQELRQHIEACYDASSAGYCSIGGPHNPHNPLTSKPQKNEMKAVNIFKEYIWLINRIYRTGGVTLAEINEAWVRTALSGGVAFDRNTFKRHLNDLQEMFGLNIEVGKGYKYHIVNAHVLRDDSVQNWLLSTLSVNNIISESMAVHERLIMESVPEVRYLSALVEAMKENRRVMIAYQKYGTTECSERVIEPYFLKLHKRRWYVMANTAGGYRVFSFDRIVKVVVTKEKFVMPADFDPKEYFADCFGVMRDERRAAQRIVLRAIGNERYYMEDLPVHQSQRLVAEGDGYADYEIMMRPTSDFIGYVLSRGSWLRVLSPQSLVEEIRGNLQRCLEGYS